jgi:hypothetical protein
VASKKNTCPASFALSARGLLFGAKSGRAIGTAWYTALSAAAAVAQLDYTLDICTAELAIIAVKDQCEGFVTTL